MITYQLSVLNHYLPGVEIKHCYSSIVCYKNKAYTKWKLSIDSVNDMGTLVGPFA